MCIVPFALLLEALAHLTALTHLSLAFSENAPVDHPEPHHDDLANALTPLTTLRSLGLRYLTGLESASVDAAVRALRH